MTIVKLNQFSFPDAKLIYFRRSSKREHLDHFVYRDLRVLETRQAHSTRSGSNKYSVQVFDVAKVDLVKDTGHGYKKFVLAHLVRASLCKLGKYGAQVEALLNYYILRHRPESFDCFSVLLTHRKDSLPDLLSHGVDQVRTRPILAQVAVRVQSGAIY